MATEIISVALHFQGYELISKVLFLIGFLSYVVLIFFYLWRLFFYFEEVKRDFLNPRKLFLYFTFVAGSNTLGVRTLLFGNVGGATLLAHIGWIFLIFL